MNELVRKTIMSQYANSPRLMAIIEALADAIDPSEFTEEFYTLVMNIPTAQGFGLDIWGRIVGVSRTVRYPNPAEDYFGFEDGFYPFGQAPFSAGSSEAGAWDLLDDAYRQLILIKAISNIAYATAPNINRIIKQIFRGTGYYLAEGDMKGAYVFEYILTPFERFIFTETNILPRPCGVEISFREVDVSSVFGFYGSGLQPFNQGVFAS